MRNLTDYVKVYYYGQGRRDVEGNLVWCYIYVCINRQEDIEFRGRTESEFGVNFKKRALACINIKISEWGLNFSFLFCFFFYLLLAMQMFYFPLVERSYSDWLSYFFILNVYWNYPLKKLFCPQNVFFSGSYIFGVNFVFFFWSLLAILFTIYCPFRADLSVKPGLPAFWHRSLLTAQMALLTTQWWCATFQSQSEWQKAYKLHGWHCTYLTSTHWHVNLVHLAGVTFPPATVSPMQPPRRRPTDSREDEQWTSEGGCMEMARVCGLGHMAAWSFIQTYQILQNIIYCLGFFFNFLKKYKWH